MIFVTLCFCHCEPSPRHSVSPSSMSAPHLVILLKDFHQIQMFSSAVFHLWHQVALHQIGFYQLTVLFVVWGNTARMHWGKNLSTWICQGLSVLGTEISEPRWRADRGLCEHKFCGVLHQIKFYDMEVVVPLVPSPGTSTHTLLFTSRNYLQHFTCIFTPASADRIVHYRSPIGCKIVIHVYEVGSCKLRYFWCQMACLHSCCVHGFSTFTVLPYQYQPSQKNLPLS